MFQLVLNKTYPIYYDKVYIYVQRVQIYMNKTRAHVFRVERSQSRFIISSSFSDKLAER